VCWNRFVFESLFPPFFFCIPVPENFRRHTHQTHSPRYPSGRDWAGLFTPTCPVPLAMSSAFLLGLIGGLDPAHTKKLVSLPWPHDLSTGKPPLLSTS
jgi:hypothetical protein